MNESSGLGPETMALSYISSLSLESTDKCPGHEEGFVCPKTCLVFLSISVDLKKILTLQNFALFMSFLGMSSNMPSICNLSNR